MALTCHYITTCYPDYLTDHHNRENEILISAWAGSTSRESIKGQLLDSACCYSKPSLFLSYKESDIRKAIAREFNQYKAKDINFTDCDSEENESYIYAYLSW